MAWTGTGASKGQEIVIEEQEMVLIALAVLQIPKRYVLY